MKNIKEIYSKHTKLPKKQLENLLKHDLYLSSQKCLEYGLVDYII